LAKLPTVQAIKDFVASSIRFLKVFREWNKDWHYQPNDPCFLHGVGYCANPDNVPEVGESPETHPNKWNIIGGVESGATSTPTPNRVVKYDDGARLRSGGYAKEPDHVIRKRELNLRVTTLQTYSKASLLLSNAEQVLRRQRGWDLGVPYLSNQAEIYHFDTDVLNQNQQSGILIESEGDNIRLVGKDDLLEGESLLPAVIGIPPYEVITKSLLGNFSVTKTLPASENSSVDFWMRPFFSENHILFRVSTPTDSVLLFVGLRDPAYATPWYGSDDPEYSEALEGDIPYSITRATGSVLEHRMPNGVETIVLDATGMDPIYDAPLESNIPYSVPDEGDPEYSVAREHEAIVEISERGWNHVAVVNTRTRLSVYISDKRFDFAKFSVADQPVTLVINEAKYFFNIDELYIDGAAALDYSSFAENTESKIPYAALDCKEKWFVLEAEDIYKVKTNLFETPQFKSAVRAVVNNNN